MIVISDTSAISGLFRVGFLHLLPALFEYVLIPQKVYFELTRLQSFGYDTHFLSSEWLSVHSIIDMDTYTQLIQELDEGEAEAITLAIETHAEWLLTDEAKGRKAAVQPNVPIIGVLGILIEAKRRGLISAIRPILDKLISIAGFRVSPSLYQAILAANKE